MVVYQEVREGFGILVFGQISKGYSSVINDIGASIRSSSGYASPAKEEFDYSF